MYYAARSDRGTGHKPIRTQLGWILATFIVGVAIIGPPLTRQTNPALVELRHDVLMIDREFDQLSLRTNYAPKMQVPGATS